MSEAASRAAIVAGVASVFAGGYFGIAHAVDPARARSLATPLDARLPFVPEAIFVYAAVYPLVLLPALLARDAEFRRYARAYLAVIAAAHLCFVLVPVGAQGLRPPPPQGADLAAWGVRLCYALDPPLNLFPSLHLALATLAAASAARLGRAAGALALAALLAVGAAACLVKQHFAADVAAGIALGLAARARWLRR
jgi:hypothetical protein